MAATNATSLRRPSHAIVELFPEQGDWTVDDYLELSERTNRLIELNNGVLEVLAMPTISHQLLLQYLFKLLDAFVTRRKLGRVIVAGYPLRTAGKNYRMPDLVFVSARKKDFLLEQFARGADLVMEVVSQDRKRDLKTKRAEYAKAGISEYWIIDPDEHRVMVLQLNDDDYEVAGDYGPGEQAKSVRLPGFAVSVDKLYAAAVI